MVNPFVHGHEALPHLELHHLVTWGCDADEFSVTAYNETFYPPLWSYGMLGTLESCLDVQPGGLVLQVVQCN